MTDVKTTVQQFSGFCDSCDYYQKTCLNSRWDHTQLQELRFEFKKFKLPCTQLAFLVWPYTAHIALMWPSLCGLT